MSQTPNRTYSYNAAVINTFELIPLLAFVLIANIVGFRPGVVVYVALSTITLVLYPLLLRRAPVLLIATGLFTLVLGVSSIYFDNETFVKIKPTIFNLAMLATLLLPGLFGLNILKIWLAPYLPFALRDTGWLYMLVAWQVFFLLGAVVNEVLWRNLSSLSWANLHFVISTTLAAVFAVVQMIIIIKYRAPHQPGNSRN